MSFIDELEDAPLVVPPSDVEVVPATKAHLTHEEEVESNLRDMENTLLEQALTQIGASQKWPEIAKELDPKDEADIPEEWIAEFGKKKAKEMYRVARAAMMPNADAPIGLKQQVLLATGIIKARSGEKRGPKILNMTLVEMPNVQVVFPEKEVK